MELNEGTLLQEHKRDVVLVLEKVLNTLNRMDERLQLIEGNTKISDEESSCIQRKSDEAVLVCVRVNIFSVSDIDTVGQEFNCEFFLAATWEEPQLRGHFNASAVDWEKTWDPRIYFVNAVEIKSLYRKHKIIKMAGTHIPVVQLSFRGAGRFKTLFSLHNFPFDFQTLKIEISSKWSNAAVVFDRTPNIPCVLSNENFLGKEEWDLLDHVLTKDSTSSEDSSKVSIMSYSSYSFEFHIRRKYSYFLTNIVFMMFLISLLSFTTFFLSPDALGDRLGVILTLLLTAVTFKFVVSQSLPPVSYLTVLDWYVLSSVIFVFSVAVENSIIARITEKRYQLAFDNASWAVSVCIFTVMHICFSVKAALIIRRVERKLGYHQRCYKWKNGLLPACKELVSRTVSQSSAFDSPPKHKATSDRRTHNVCQGMKSSHEKNPFELDETGHAFLRRTDVISGFPNDTDHTLHVCSDNAAVNDTLSLIFEECEEQKQNDLPAAERLETKSRTKFDGNHRGQDSITDCSEGPSLKPVVAGYLNSPQSTSELETKTIRKQSRHLRMMASIGAVKEEGSSGKRGFQSLNLNSHPNDMLDSQIVKSNVVVDDIEQDSSGKTSRHPSSNFVKSACTGLKFGMQSSSNLATINENEIFTDQNKDGSMFETKKRKSVTFSSRNISAKKQADNDYENADESSSSYLSDSDIVGPIPKTESEISVSLFRGNLSMNFGNGLTRG